MKTSEDPRDDGSVELGKRVGGARRAPTPARGRWQPGGAAVELFDPAHFLVATRDSGYRSTAFCLAEFIDNAIQAGASTVDVELRVGNDPEFPVEITVSDDGAGMDAPTLATALAFGGSSRFGDRASLGRYGMGLPNGALSRARRVEVYSTKGKRTVRGVLDLDKVVESRAAVLPAIEAIRRPEFIPPRTSGTTVRLVRCDRLEHKRPSTLIPKLARELGRIYRRFLVAGLGLRVNSERVVPRDPLFLDGTARAEVTGRQFGDALTYKLTEAGVSGTIQVRFSELPVGALHTLSVQRKRDEGITGAPNVSVLRAGREIDRGWFFMGGKRRENYDDWWRCEVAFDPSLDEMFGITHAKQEIRPTRALCEVLERDLEPIARALNARVRRRFEVAKATTPLAVAEDQAARANLPPLPSSTGRRRGRQVVPAGIRPLDGLDPADGNRADRPYLIRIAEFSGTDAYRVSTSGSQTCVFLNVRHPLYHHIYEPLASSDEPAARRTASDLALVVLAAARAEVALGGAPDRTPLPAFRTLWADVLASFVNA